MKRNLPIAGPELPGIGLPTIMSRALAARYGRPYVELAVFAIDTDRLRLSLEIVPDTELPFGWEVWLTQVFLQRRFDPSDAGHHSLIEEACGVAHDLSLEGDCLGAQILFAVYDLVDRQEWPEDLRTLFANWKKPPTEVQVAIDFVRRDRSAQRRVLETCQAAEVSELTRKALQELSVGYTDHR